MLGIAIGVRVSAGGPHLADTLAWLASNTRVPFALRVFGVEPEQQSGAMGVALHSLTRECPARLYILLESGALPGPFWLEALQEVFRRVPSCGLAGPSTNLAPNRQAIFSHSGDDVARNAMAARLRFGAAYRSLERSEYLSEFCVAFRSELVDTVGAVPNSLDCVMEITKQGNRVGFAALWACGAYVHCLRSRMSSVTAKPPRFRPSSQFFEGFEDGHRDEPLTPLVAKEHEEQASLKAVVSTGVPFEIGKNVSPEHAESPLVSCIMPTFNRRSFLPRALRCFFSQDYPNLELIVVDDGTDPIVDLLPSDPRIRYFKLEGKQNVGAKRNFACEQARGEFVVHWDDDEWYRPSRVRCQIEALRNSQARISGTSVAFFYHENSGHAFRYCYQGFAASWMGALAYPRSVWKDRPFDSVPIAEDVRFITKIPASQRMDLKDPTLYVASIHATNTSPKVTTGSYWKPEPIETIREIPGFQPIANLSMAAL
jgi:Glycosyl transferase family 2